MAWWSLLRSGGWSHYMNDEMTAGIVAGIGQADAVLLGRITHLEHLRHDPRRQGH